jgi:hypothetical protein
MQVSEKFSQEKISAMEELNSKLLNKNPAPNSNIIFAYCPPKVGSTTLVTSLRLSAAQKFTIIHIHDKTLFSAISENEFIGQIEVNDYILYNKLLGKNVYVIDIFRSPIERKISEFFEYIGTLHFNNSEQNINTYNVEKVFRRFNNLFPYLGNSDHYKGFFGLTSFPDKFDFENGYLIQEMEGVKYIKLRLKDSAKWGNILTSILGTPITIVNDYETENKPLSNLFRNFKMFYRIPSNFLEDLKCDASIYYYYNEEETAEYINFWESRQDAFCTSYTNDEYIFYTQMCLENQSQNIIQTKHYIDIGCLCVACSLKRSSLLSKAMRGEVVTEKIVHEDAVNEIKNVISIKNRIIQQRVNKLNEQINSSNLRIYRPSSRGTSVVKNNMKNIVNK